MISGFLRVLLAQNADASRAKNPRRSKGKRTELPVAVGSLIRAVLVQLVHVSRNALAFSLQIILDRPGEARVREPMRRQRFDRHQSTEHLVLALRAAFEALEPMRDRELDRLVVARLEVQ